MSENDLDKTIWHLNHEQDQMNKTTLPIKISEIEQRYGGLRKAARVLQIDPAYLYRLKTGEKKNPGLAVLAKLGLRRDTRYRDGK